LKNMSGAVNRMRYPLPLPMKYHQAETQEEASPDMADTSVNRKRTQKDHHLTILVQIGNSRKHRFVDLEEIGGLAIMTVRKRVQRKLPEHLALHQDERIILY
jgi:hypothetical protein